MYLRAGTDRPGSPRAGAAHLAAMTKTTYERGEDPRGMTRGTLVRHLRADMVDTPESRTLKRRIYDDWTTGWVVEWTNSRYAETYVRWANGSADGRSRPEAERTRLRDIALTEVEKVLTARGYVLRRETGCVLVLRRNGSR